MSVRSNLTTGDRRALQQLRTMSQSIYVRQPDKYSALVINDRDKYEVDVFCHLSQDKYYKAILEIPWQTMMNHWKATQKHIVDALKDPVFEHAQECRRLLSYINRDFNKFFGMNPAKPKIPYFFGLYKIHKVEELQATKPMDNLSSFDTTQIPIRPVINGGDDFRKNAWRWISQSM